LTSRERLLRTFRRQPVDRIPVAPFLYYNSVYEMFGYQPSIDNFLDPPDFDPIAKFLDYCARFGFDALHILGSAWDAAAVDRSAENWDVHIQREGDAERQCRPGVRSLLRAHGRRFIARESHPGSQTCWSG